MGMDVEMLPEKGPHFPNPLKTPADDQYKEIMERKVDVRKELDYVYQAITMTRHKLKGRVPLFGFCGAPWTLLCYMVEGGGSKLFIASKTWIYKYPAESQALLLKIAELCIDYLALQVKAGAQIVQVFDSWAEQLSPQAFKKFSLPYLRQISKGLPDRLRALGLEQVPMVVFAKGAWYALDELCNSGYQVVGLDWLQDPAKAVKIAKGRVILQGNADPGVLYGGKEVISEAVKEMVGGFGGGHKGWIANLGHGKGFPTYVFCAQFRVRRCLCLPRCPASSQPRQLEVLLRRDTPSGKEKRIEWGIETTMKDTSVYDAWRVFTQMHDATFSTYRYLRSCKRGVNNTPKNRNVQAYQILGCSSMNFFIRA